MQNEDCRGEIISSIKNSSDEDNLIIGAFIAGLQAKSKAVVPAPCVTQPENIVIQAERRVQR